MGWAWGHQADTVNETISCSFWPGQRTAPPFWGLNQTVSLSVSHTAAGGGGEQFGRVDQQGGQQGGPAGRTAGRTSSMTVLIACARHFLKDPITVTCRSPLKDHEDMGKQPKGQVTGTRKGMQLTHIANCDNVTFSVTQFKISRWPGKTKQQQQKQNP